MTEEIIAESGSEEVVETPENNAGEEARPSLSDSINAALDHAGLEDDRPGARKPEKAEATPKEPVEPSKASEDAPREKRGSKQAKPEPKPEQPATATAPEHWPQPRREAFAKLPPEAQRLVNDMAKDLEAGFTKKSTETADDVRLAKAIRSSVSDDQRAVLQQAGIDEAQGIQRLLQLDQYARQNPADYVRWVTKEAGLDPRQLFPNLAGSAPQQGQLPQQQPQPQADPYNPLVQKVSQLESWIAQQEQQRQNSEAKQVSDIYGQFRDAKDEAGNPVNVYLPRVEDRLAEVLRTPSMLAIPDKAERLRKAYEQVIWADPLIRSEIQTREREKAEAARKAEQETEKARRAKPAVRGQSRASDGKFAPSKLSDVVSQAMDQAGI